jgi:predicted cupin superfamily sugar epimerase
MEAEKIIQLLGLKPHPEEGGFYSEVYRSDESVSGNALHERYASGRANGTSIYYLLTRDTFSAMHRLKSDEIFHFYMGDPVGILMLTPDGSGKKAYLGTDLEAGMRPQVTVPKNVWQGSRLLPGGRYALLGTTVAPGFEFEDYENGSFEHLAEKYPSWIEEIKPLVRGRHS